MSQFSTMTTNERKMQAAAICREVEAQEDVEMDLGKKVNMPKDIMLEELSLASNRGSRLFKMRQRRSEKYTFESIQNINNMQLNSIGKPLHKALHPDREDVGKIKRLKCLFDLCYRHGLAQHRVLTTAFHTNTMVSQTENGCATDGHNGENNADVDQSPAVPSDTLDTSMVPNPDCIAPGYGGPLKDIPPEKFNSTAVPKSYHSPWEQAIISDPALAHTLNTHMSEPEPRPDIPGYKSFNRVATPFGGFGNAARPAAIKFLQVEPLPECPELQGDEAGDRPSFNRSALGWVSSGDPLPLPAVPLEHALIPESDDL